MILDALPLGSVALCALGLAMGLRESWLALLAAPAVLWGPGLGFARALAARDRHDGDGLRVAFDAFWIGSVLAVGTVTAARWAGGGTPAASVALGASAGWGMLGATVRRRAGASAKISLPRGRSGEVVGLASALLLVGAWFWMARVDIARPLDRYWWTNKLEDLAAEGEIEPGGGWAEATRLDDEGALWRLLPPEGATATLSSAGPGPILVAIRGPMGTRLQVGESSVTIARSPTVDVNEGPVRRYRDAGVASVLLSHSEGPLPVRVEGGDDTVMLWAFASQDAVWELDASGELRFAHYYQLLNMAEQFDWAAERWVTDVQPPLWSWVLAAPLAVTDGDLPTANVLCAYVLVLSALAGLLFLRTYAPEAPLPAWALPGAAAMVTGRLLTEPGSAMMPDALYAAAIVGALAHLRERGRPELLGLAAQLLRYPGSAVVFVGALLDGRPRVAVRIGVLVAATAGVFALGGAMTGALSGWMATVAWESGPEHWHGNTDPAELLGRVPGFIELWTLYSGGTALLAACRWPRGTRVALGTAAIYALLLCTIDHSPTHYFLPLVQLSAVATGCTAAAMPTRILGTLWATAGLAGLSIFWFSGNIGG